MNTFHTRAIGLALGIAFSTGGLAAGISQDEYSAGKDWIAAEYKVANAIKDGMATQRAADLKLANAKCDGLSGGAKEVCAKDAEARFGK